MKTKKKKTYFKHENFKKKNSKRVLIHTWGGNKMQRRHEHVRTMHKKYEKNAQDNKKTQKETKTWAAARGECDLTLQGSPSGRNLSDVRT